VTAFVVTIGLNPVSASAGLLIKCILFQLQIY
jgi:hypothetical protein